MALEFHPSPRSVGLEWELQLLDSETLDLVDGILPLMDLIPDRAHIKPEFIQNTVEIVTSPCGNLAQAELEIRELLGTLQIRCAQLGMRICGAGTHPFGQQLGLLTPLPRYLELEQSMGHMAHTQITFGMHVHVGMQSGDEAIAVMNRLVAYVPVLVALSANSPCWRGHETGHESYRLRILEGARTYGVPPLFANWEEFSAFLESTVRAGIYKGINNIHWDIRPRPGLGTLEVRVMDALSTLAETIDLAGVIVGLIEFISDRINVGGEGDLLPLPHPWIQKENRFQAGRCGVAANYVGANIDDVRCLRDIVVETLNAVGGDCAMKILDRVNESKLGYHRQHAVYRDTGSFVAVAGALVDSLLQS